MNFDVWPIFSRLPSAFSSIVVRPPSMLPLVGWTSDRSSTLCGLDDVVLVGLPHAYQRSPTSGLMARALQMCSPPVISEVSPKTP